VRNIQEPLKVIDAQLVASFKFAVVL